MTRKGVVNGNGHTGDGHRVSSDELERRRAASRAHQTRVRAKAPQVPSRYWTVAEMRHVFLTEGTLLEAAIQLNRNYNDVANLSQELTQLFAVDPTVLAAYIGLTTIELRAKHGYNNRVLEVCDECFTTPHQQSCNNAEGA